MRVPIENGSGLGQPGYQILLSSLPLIGTEFKLFKELYLFLTDFYIAHRRFLIAGKDTENIFSSFEIG
jgi:hypothetical protein